jgi:hypothetical protein
MNAIKTFRLLRKVPLPELQATLVELVHDQSGARVMQIENSDPENLFSLLLPTLPSSSNGAPHILEHTVLCGSKKFPVKDPFFAMARRSLHTFMNAMTGSDFTCYPAASQVQADFYNLFEVYLDAVFHPILRKESFLQEGFRLEIEADTLEGKGIVYNEMKGALASGDARVWHVVMEALFPDLPYGYVSGGEPTEIRTLTYDELLAFHRKFYHPSRCLFFFYGNFPLEGHLEFLEKNLLHNVEKLEPLPKLPRQKRFSTPIQREGVYPAADPEEKAICAFAFLTAPLDDPETVLALTLLDVIWMENDASPLRRALLQSGLCTAAGSALDAEIAEVPYGIFCKGCKAEHLDPLAQVIEEEMRRIAKEGIDPEKVRSALHLLEFSRTEITGGQAPFGLTLFFRAALAEAHGCPPEYGLQIHAIFDKLLKKTENRRFLPELIETYFLNNPHRVRVAMRPDLHLLEKEGGEEKSYFDKLLGTLSEAKKHDVIAEAEKLQKYQREIEAQSLDVLPSVQLSDVPSMGKRFPLEEKNNIFHHDCFTNGIVEIDLVFDLPEVPEEELPQMQLVTTLLAELGAGSRRYTEMLPFLQAHTGGVAAALAVHVPIDRPSQVRPALMLRGKALERNVPQLVEAMYAMITAPRLDEEARIIELVLQMNTALQSHLTQSAMRYAGQLALSSLSPSGRIGHLWHGLPFVQMISQLSQDRDLLLKTVREALPKLLAYQTPELVIAGSAAAYDKLLKEGCYGLLDLPIPRGNRWNPDIAIPKVPSQGRKIASPVAFTSWALPAPTYLDPAAPALGLAAGIMEHNVLHPKIREEGGAYGAGANYFPTAGHFTFHAYRDPSIASSIAAFHTAIDEVARGEFDDEDLKEAKLGMIQELDTPVAPGGRARIAYHWRREGKTDPIRQSYREAILRASKKEVAEAVARHLRGQEGTVVTLAEEPLLKREFALLPKRLPIIPLFG